jgi:hypothetical protein
VVIVIGMVCKEEEEEEDTTTHMSAHFLPRHH